MCIMLKTFPISPLSPSDPGKKSFWFFDQLSSPNFFKLVNCTTPPHASWKTSKTVEMDNNKHQTTCAMNDAPGHRQLACRDLQGGRLCHHPISHAKIMNTHPNQKQCPQPHQQSHPTQVILLKWQHWCFYPLIYQTLKNYGTVQTFVMSPDQMIFYCKWSTCIVVPYTVMSIQLVCLNVFFKKWTNSDM